MATHTPQLPIIIQPMMYRGKPVKQPEQMDNDDKLGGKRFGKLNQRLRKKIFTMMFEDDDGLAPEGEITIKIECDKVPLLEAPGDLNYSRRCVIKTPMPMKSVLEDVEYCKLYSASLEEDEDDEDDEAVKHQLAIAGMCHNLQQESLEALFEGATLRFEINGWWNEAEDGANGWRCTHVFQLLDQFLQQMPYVSLVSHLVFGYNRLCEYNGVHLGALGWRCLQEKVPHFTVYLPHLVQPRVTMAVEVDWSEVPLLCKRHAHLWEWGESEFHISLGQRREGRRDFDAMVTALKRWQVIVLGMRDDLSRCRCDREVFGQFVREIVAAGNSV